MNIAETTISDKMAKEFSSTDNAGTIGSILLNAGKISRTDADYIVALQKQKGLRFGDAAKALGFINENDIQKALSDQFDFPFQEAADENLSRELYAAYEPFCAQTETLRCVRGQLILRWFTDTRKFLAIASSGRSEGRSTLAANLAIVFSQLGKRTLLIDADLRQPRQGDLFKLKSRYGLSDMLAGRADSSVLTQIPVFPDLSLLPSGTVPPNPTELISRGLKNCLHQLDAKFDIVLIDTPSAEWGIDAQIIAAICGGALLLARQHQTRINDLQLLKTALQDSGCECLGAVLTEF
jgi:protein-tyrosine kinase